MERRNSHCENCKSATNHKKTVAANFEIVAECQVCGTVTSWTEKEDTKIESEKAILDMEAA